MSQSTVLKRGQVVWVDLDPALGSEASGRRPALVVSSDENNAVMPTLTVAPLTSSVKRIYPFEVFIDADEFGLQKDSGLHNLKVQLQQIRTLSRERIVEQIGLASATTMRLLYQALKLNH